MKKSGVDYFMTTKLAWNQINKIPNDTFIWRGIDGSQVLTHLITTLNVGQDPKENFFTTYNGILHPDAIMGGWERYQNKEINNDTALNHYLEDCHHLAYTHTIKAESINEKIFQESGNFRTHLLYRRKYRFFHSIFHHRFHPSFPARSFIFQPAPR